MAAIPDVVSRRLPRPPFPYSAPTFPGGVEVPEPPPRSGPDYDTDWARRYPARLARAALVETLGRGLVTALARPRVAGLDRLDVLDGRANGAGGRDRAAGPVIFAANHHSHVDTPVLLTAIPDMWRHRLFVGGAADYFFRTRITSALSALCIGAIPIERTRVSRRSADRAAHLIDAGWSMLIFPEGGRSPDGWGQPFLGGAAYLGLRCGVPVVPVHLLGTGRILRKGSRRPRPAAVTVTFGTPILPQVGTNARRLSAAIERAVEALADEATTDWWSARRRAHAGTSPALTGPRAAAWRRAWALGDRDAKRRRQRRSWPQV
ncbi:MAG TPA: lysophospholipid acyltransferase family protein [Acidimicrobiales bacterium]|jgi:1-acyl-sn-glycerol-3-phosphate acyltransferase|nr:lysophospholipid acyltransferase family protein [Acidimicrobiales bacterium]